MPWPRFSRRVWTAAALPVAAALALPVLVVVLAPLGPAGEAWPHLSRELLPDYLLNTLRLACGVAFGSLLLGVIPAWLISTYHFPGVRVLGWALVLPLALPGYVIAYAYTGLLDSSGPVYAFVRTWFDATLPHLPVRSLGGAVCMLSLVLYPYVYLLLRAALLEQSPCQVEAARTLGCGRVSAFFRVRALQARPALATGLALVLMETVADYGTVQYFGLPVLSTGIFKAWQGFGDPSTAVRLSALLLGASALCLFLERYTRYRRRYHQDGAGPNAGAARVHLRGARAWLACGACALPPLCGFMLPCILLAGWSLDNVASIQRDGFGVLLVHSLLLAAGSAGLTVALALLLAYARHLAPRPPILLATGLARLGYAAPGAVIAIGVLIPAVWLDHRLYAWFPGLADGRALLSGTAGILVFAYLVRFLAPALQTLEGALERLRPSMEETARLLGSSAGGILRRLHLPLIRPSLATAALLVFVEVLQELPATLLLRPFDFTTLALRAYELANEERLVEAAAPALAIMGAGIPAVLLLYLSMTRTSWAADNA